MKKILIPALIIAAAASLCLTLRASVLDRDDEVLCFPAAGYRTSGSTITAQIRCWVFNSEIDSVKRDILMNAVQSVLGSAPADSETATFRERARWFLVDNQRGKELVVIVGGHRFALPKTGPDGHTTAAIQFSLPGEQPPGKPLPFRITDAAGRTAADGAILLSGPGEGLSVVSDIDDTIKLSMVKDRRELARNTFLRPFAPVPGMAKRYTAWAGEGAVFHYVSGSPWHLYPPLRDFLMGQAFPAGTIHLKDFRLKDPSAMRFIVADQKGYKLTVIEELMAAAPGRRFVLVGDAGEMDPEIYGLLCRRHPNQVGAIYIRDTEPVSRSAQRYRAAFDGITAEWLIFAEAHELPERIGSLLKRP